MKIRKIYRSYVTRNKNNITESLVVCQAGTFATFDIAKMFVITRIWFCFKFSTVVIISTVLPELAYWSYVVRRGCKKSYWYAFLQKKTFNFLCWERRELTEWTWVHVISTKYIVSCSSTTTLYYERNVKRTQYNRPCIKISSNLDQFFLRSQSSSNINSCCISAADHVFSRNYTILFLKYRGRYNRSC